jgi:hypothetical protein
MVAGGKREARRHRITSTSESVGRPGRGAGLRHPAGVQRRCSLNREPRAAALRALPGATIRHASSVRSGTECAAQLTPAADPSRCAAACQVRYTCASRAGPLRRRSVRPWLQT